MPFLVPKYTSRRKGTNKMKVSIPRVRNYLLPLPAHVKLAVNQKLRDGWRHRTVSDWLFAQIADRDIPEYLLKAGDPYALI